MQVTIIYYLIPLNRINRYIIFDQLQDYRLVKENKILKEIDIIMMFSVVTFDLP